MDQRILRYLVDHHQQMIEDVQRLVESESPSTDKARLDQTAELVTEWLAASGFTISVVKQEQAGNHVRGYLPGTVEEAPLLILAHYDTVWKAGTLVDIPFSHADGILRGPGVFDMKVGLVQAVWAVRALRAVGKVRRPIVFLSNSDEEIGSVCSRSLIEEEARQAHLALVFEASHHGALKTARKGTLMYEWHLYGKASHAGLAPGEGVSAVEELADQIVALRRVADPEKGTTVNVGVIEGGSRSNVVPAEARASLDVRVLTMSEADRIAAYMTGLRPIREGVRIAVSGGLNRPPMERTAKVVELFRRVQAIGHDLGIDLEEATVGGASDGNFCAAIGIPVLDGMGAVGDGAHANHEHVVAETMPVRAALAAHLLAVL